MNVCLNDEQKSDFLKRGFSRRTLGRIAAMMAAGATLPFYNESAMAQLSAIRGPMPPDAVKINANENPLGPCPEALQAIHSVAAQGGRYLYEETFGFQELLAEQEGIKPNYVMPYGGSSAPLHQAVLGFCSPTKSFVTADPGYEAGERAAQFIGAKVARVPLTKTYAHDVKAMAAADPNAGLIYVCNPNNPTGTLTPRAANTSGSSRLKLIDSCEPDTAATRSTGLAHQVTMRLKSPAVAMAARPIKPSLTASQRVRVTLWLHARANVPASISRVTSGAPQKTPMRAGAANMTPMPT